MMADSFAGKNHINLFDFSLILSDSPSYPSSYETSNSSRCCSLFDLDSWETSSITDYSFDPLGVFNHPFELRIPQGASSSLLPQQDEGYVTPDFEAEDPPVVVKEPNEPAPEFSQSHSWATLTGIVSEDKPLLSTCRDEESITKMLWLATSDKNCWYHNDPTIVSHQELVQNLRFLLVGVPSRLFLLNQDTQQFSVLKNIKVPGTSRAFLDAFVKDFLYCGNTARHLDSLGSSAARKLHGLVYDALCQALSVYLQAVRSSVLLLDLSNASFAGVSHATAPLRSQLLTVGRACLDLDGSSPPYGGHLIDRLFTELQATPTSADAAILYSLLRSCLSVYFGWLFKWIFKGEINDPHQEFFIDKKLPHVISNSRNFWTRGFVCVDQLLPSFLSDLRDEILACGKAACLLRICDPENPLFRLIDETSIVKDITDNCNSISSLQEVVEAYYQQCKNVLGTGERFTFSDSDKKEEQLKEAARLAHERNWALYEAKRRKKLEEVAQKKYQELLELKQHIDELKLQKEEEEKLRLEAENKWLERIKKEHELDLILEQTKQAKIGEFYKSLFEESQKRVALTVWKLKRTKLSEQRAHFFRNDFYPKAPGSTPSCSAALEGDISQDASDKPSAELVRSLIDQLDDPADKATECETLLSSEMTPGVDDANFRVWLADKDQALKNRMKVLSSDLGDCFVEVGPGPENSVVTTTATTYDHSTNTLENSKNQALNNKEKVLSSDPDNFFTNTSTKSEVIIVKRIEANNLLEEDRAQALKNKEKVLSAGLDNFLTDINPESEVADVQRTKVKDLPEASKTQALKNKEKVLSSYLGHIFSDFNPKSVGGGVSKTKTSEQMTGKDDGGSSYSQPISIIKSPISDTDQACSSSENISKLQIGTTDKGLCFENSSGDNKSAESGHAQSPGSKSDTESLSPSNDVKASHRVVDTTNGLNPRTDTSTLPTPQTDIELPNQINVAESLSERSLQKQLITENDTTMSSCSKVDFAGLPGIYESKSFNANSQRGKFVDSNPSRSGGPTDLLQSIEGEPSTLSELENPLYANISALRVKTDPFDSILSVSNHSHSYDLSTALSLTIESVRLPLSVHARVANHALMKYFIEAGLLAHLQLLKKHYLLHDAGWKSGLMRGLSSRFHEFKGLDPKQVNWSRVASEAFAEATSPEEIDPGLCLILDVKNPPAVLDITDPEVFDCFSLQYLYEWPLNLIITPDAISRYNVIFRFLLKLSYVDWTLKNQFQLLSDKNIKRGTHYKQICLFRHTMTQFIHPLACFISESIIQMEFNHLLKELERDCCIDSIFYKHVDFIKYLLFNCFLTTKGESMKKAFNKLFKYVLQFNEALVLGTWNIDPTTNELVHSNFAYLKLSALKFLALARDTTDYLQKISDEGGQVKLHCLTAQLSFGNK